MTMADDREILREVWEGRVPVVFSLSSDEVEVETPENIYAMVSRQTYFPLATEKAVKYFSQYVEKDKLGEMWIDFEGQPLRWHYPVGLLYDLHGRDASLPWNLTVHFQNFPEEDLLSCPSKDAIESHFMSVIKEADALKHRSHVINNMQKKEHKQMWLGLSNAMLDKVGYHLDKVGYDFDKFDQFWQVNKKLMESSGEEMFKSIPFRIYQNDVPVIQKLFRPYSEEGFEHTLKQLLEFCLPDQNIENDLQVLIQGIELPLDTPVLWLSEHLSYPDNFLHICVSQKDTSKSTETW